MFTVSKATAGRVPDLEERLIDKDLVIRGVAVQKDLTLADAAADIPAYICVSKWDEALYPNGPDGSDKVKALLMPLDQQTMIEADVIGTKTADIIVGYETSIATGGLGVLPTINTTINDFRVTKILDVDASGYATRVAGFFIKATGFYA